MPNSGILRSNTARVTETTWSAVAGSPGPLDRKTPSGASASSSSGLIEAGTTCTRMPRRAKLRGVLVLMPRSRAATVNRCAPSGSTVYVLAVLTSPARSAPSMAGCPLTRESRKSVGASATVPLKMPAFIDPRVRRCRTTARVSMPAMPTTCCALRASSKVPLARQFDTRFEGSRTAYPATQILPPRLSSSSSFHPVLPIWGAVATTICRW
ncbi:Uncharacterised protein [Mycobacteroides abscessus]|nr:Uncharacterised protein [Mycobacteroides abscessus]